MSDDTNYYQVQNTPVDGVAPGDVIELSPSVADAFADNLEEVDADSKEAAQEEADANPATPGATTTAADLDTEAGEYIVQHTPIDDVQPGDVISVPPEVAAAFADNLEVAEDVDDEDATAEDADDEDSEEKATPDDEFTTDGDFDADAFVDRTPQREVRSDIASGRYDDHLDDIEAAENENRDRDGVQDAVDSRRDAA